MSNKNKIKRKYIIQQSTLGAFFAIFVLSGCVIQEYISIICFELVNRTELRSIINKQNQTL